MRVALVPGVPALLPAYASIEDPVSDLRAACAAAVAWLGPRVRVIAASDPGGRVARALVAAAGGEVVGPEATEPSGVLVVGNGSAKRTEKAPGHFDERAQVFDDDVRRALLQPVPDALTALDEQLAAELWADVGALPALGDLLTPASAAEVAYDAAPYGVQYWVIRWW